MVGRQEGDGEWDGWDDGFGETVLGSDAWSDRQGMNGRRLAGSSGQFCGEREVGVGWAPGW